MKPIQKLPVNSRGIKVYTIRLGKGFRIILSKVFQLNTSFNSSYSCPKWKLQKRISSQINLGTVKSTFSFLEIYDFHCHNKGSEMSHSQETCFISFKPVFSGLTFCSTFLLETPEFLKILSKYNNLPKHTYNVSS